jgi:eukaryotic-like serine/threonine-protein kinase
VSLRAGQVISHYRVLEQVGAGGMGVVWKAHDITLDRAVALKFLAEHLARDEGRLERFRREATTIAALNHANIVQIFSVEEADGVPFIAMEFVVGQSLAVSIPAGGMALERFFELAVPLADALHASHEKDIVHRDLKPGNIMVGNDGRARIVDFGLAQLRVPRPPGSDSSASTLSDRQQHAAGGTLPYMSPEQLQGKSVDPRSDIFSFGEVLYEMATGERPFRAETSADLIAAIMRSEPARVTDLNPALPRQLERIIERCMRKDRRRRFQTALDVRNELEELRRELQAVERTRGAADGLEGVAHLARGSVAVLPLRNLGSGKDSEYFSDGLTEELISALARVKSLRVVSRTSAFALREAGLSAQEIGRRLRVGTVVEGSVHLAAHHLRVNVRLVETIEGYHLWAETYDLELQDVFRVQEDISRSVVQALNVSLEAAAPGRSRRYTDNLAAYQQYLKGRYFWHQETPDGFQQALACFEQALKAEPAYAPAHTGIADYYAMLGFWGIVRPAEAWPLAQSSAMRAVEIDPELAEAHVSLGLVRLFFDWNAETADAEFRRALELHSGLAEPHYGRALVLTQAGETAGALEHIGKARSLDPLSAMLQSTEAWIHYYARRYAEAIAGCQRTLEMHPGFLEAHIGLGLAYKEIHQFDRALQELERARELSQGNPLVLGVLGATLAHSGRQAAATALVDELERKQDGYVAPIAYAMLYSGLANEPRTIAYLRDALEAKDGLVRYLSVSPLFDSVRSSRDFEDLLATLKLNPAPRTKKGATYGRERQHHTP